MAKRTVKRWDIEVDKGLATNYSPDSIATKYLTSCANMDGYDQFRGLGKMPGSALIAPSANPGASACGGIFYYEGYTRSNVFAKDTLAVYDGSVFLLDEANEQLDALTMPTSTLTDGDGNGSQQVRAVQAWGRLFLTAPDATALRTGMIAWDGEALDEVGVLAPGELITLVDGTQLATNWTATGGTVTSSTLVQLGSESINVSKTSTTATQVRIDLSGANYDLTVAGDNTIYFYVYVPADVIDKIQEQSGIQVIYGESTLPTSGFNLHAYDRGDINIGWNLLSFNTSTPDVGGSATLTDVNNIRVTIDTNLATDTFTGLLFNGVYYTDNPSPTLYQGFPAEGLNDSGSWAAGTDSTVTFRSATSFPSKDGQGTVQLSKSGTAGTTAYMDNTDGFNWSAVGGHVYVWAYINNVSYGLLELTGTALQIAYGDNTFTNFATFQRTKTQLRPGWQLFDIDFANPSTTGGTGAALATIARVRLQFWTESSASVSSGVVWDFMHTRDAGIEHFAGNVSGTVSYVVTFVNDRGIESNAGTASNSKAITTGVCVLADVPVSDQNSVVERRIYRDLGGDGVYRYVGSILDNQETNFVDNISASGLATTQPPFKGDATFDNSPPGRFHDMISYNGRTIGIDATERNVIRFSDINIPDIFRLIDRITGEEPFNAIRLHAAGPMVYASDATYLMRGDGISSPFYLERLSSTVGANNWRAVAEAKGSHFVLHERKAYLLQNPQDPWYISGPIQDLFDVAEVSEEQPGAVLHDFARSRVLFFFETADGVKCYQWQYGTRGEQAITGDGPGVDPQDIRNGSWEEVLPHENILTNNIPISESFFVNAEREDVDNFGDVTQVLIASSNGVYVLNRPGLVNDFPDGLNEAAEPIAATVTFAAVPIGRDLGGRGIPRYLSVDVYCSAATTWTAAVELLSGPDGDVISTVTRSLALPMGHSSPVIALSGEGRRGSWARLTLSNATAGGVGQFKGPVRLFYIPRSAGHGVRSA